MHSHRMRVLDTPDRWDRWDRRHRTITRRLENRTGNTMLVALPQYIKMEPQEKKIRKQKMIMEVFSPVIIIIIP